MSNSIKTILFDLDGTLFDTAPDLGNALNILLTKYNRPTMSLAEIRTVASDGAQGLLQLGFSITNQHPDYPHLREQFLEIYAENIARDTQYFPGMSLVIDELNERQMPWGIVTNKNTYLTHLLLDKLQLSPQPNCVIGGDTLKYMKPHPAPLIHACQLLNSSPYECLYVGDAQRDIEAGRRAGMQTMVALYGYINKDSDPRNWGADGYINQPPELITWIDNGVNLHKELSI